MYTLPPRLNPPNPPPPLYLMQSGSPGWLREEYGSTRQYGYVEQLQDRQENSR